MAKKMSKKLSIIIISVSLAVLITLGVILGIILGGKKDQTVSAGLDDIPATDIDLVVNQTTEYKIVIPSEPSNFEKYAAEELVLYLSNSTGINFNVISDDSVEFNEVDKMLSIGETIIKEQSEVKVPFDEFGRDGFKIVRKGNTVVLCGGGGYGTLYAVYEFLHRQIGWEPYSVDEIYYERLINIKLLDYDYSDKPAMEDRYGGWYVATSDVSFAAKRRTFAAAGNMLFNESLWYFFPHATFKLVSPAEHYDEHPDWFAASKQQICYSSEGCQQAIIDAMKRVFTENPSIKYIPVGLEDNYAVCSCSKCEESIEQYGYSGMLVRWTNVVNAEIQRWRIEQGIERELYIPLLAYYQIRKPPVKTSEGGEVVPIDDSCVLNDHSPVIFAPIEMDMDYSWEDQENVAVMVDVEGWLKCSSKFIMYHYNGSGTTVFEWHDSLYRTVKDYKLASTLGAMQVYDDASNDTLQACAFQIMMGYVYSKAQWNPDVDTNQLVKNFIYHYYKDAREEILEYYYLLKMQYRIAYDEMLASGSKKFSTKDWMSKGLLEQAQALVRKGLQDVLNNPNYTDEERTKYVARVEHELLTPLIYILDYLPNEYTKQSYYSIIDEVESLVNKYGFSYITGPYSYSKTNEQKYAEWRANKQ